MPETFYSGKLRVKVYSNREALGAAAAQAAAEKINELLQTQAYVTAIFAAAPSQDTFLQNLLQQDLPWDKVVAVHMDEYMHFNPAAPQSFGRFLRDRLFDKVALRECLLFNAAADDVEQERLRYANILAAHPIDIAFIGIGENCHIAFNDPDSCDFDDSEAVRQVTLSPESRQQQVNDGCFAALEQVPTTALTVTIPPIFSAKSILCMVPGMTKAAAVKNTLAQAITPQCPSTVLRKHEDATLYLDEESASGL